MRCTILFSLCLVCALEISFANQTVFPTHGQATIFSRSSTLSEGSGFELKSNEYDNPGYITIVSLETDLYETELYRPDAFETDNFEPDDFGDIDKKSSEVPKRDTLGTSGKSQFPSSSRVTFSSIVSENSRFSSLQEQLKPSSHPTVSLPFLTLLLLESSTSSAFITNNHIIEKGFSPKEAKNNLKAEAKLYIQPQFQKHKPNYEVVDVVYAKPKVSWLNTEYNENAESGIGPKKNLSQTGLDTVEDKEVQELVVEDLWTAEDFWTTQHMTHEAQSLETSEMVDTLEGELNIQHSTSRFFEANQVTLSMSLATNTLTTEVATSEIFQVYEPRRLQVEYEKLQSTTQGYPISTAMTQALTSLEGQSWAMTSRNRTRRRRRTPKRKFNFPSLSWLELRASVNLPLWLLCLLVALL